jgi:hypothetical protein
VEGQIRTEPKWEGLTTWSSLTDTCQLFNTQPFTRRRATIGSDQRDRRLEVGRSESDQVEVRTAPKWEGLTTWSPLSDTCQPFNTPPFTDRRATSASDQRERRLEVGRSDQVEGPIRTEAKWEGLTTWSPGS